MSCDATLEIFWGAAPFSLVGAGASSSSFFIGLLWKIKKTLNNNIGCEMSPEKFRRWFSTGPDLLSFNDAVKAYRDIWWPYHNYILYACFNFFIKKPHIFKITIFLLR